MRENDVFKIIDPYEALGANIIVNLNNIYAHCTFSIVK